MEFHILGEFDESYNRHRNCTLVYLLDSDDWKLLIALRCGWEFFEFKGFLSLTSYVTLVNEKNWT
jgi:hypothetical protein